MVKLNLGCGNDYLPGYINVDFYAEYPVDAKFDIRHIPHEDNSVDEIMASHVIEHFDYHESVLVLSEWRRVLRPGGKLTIETPDFTESCREFLISDEAAQVALMGHFLSEPWIPGQTHKMLFTERQMRQHLGWAGFDVNKVKKIPPMSKYLAVYPANIFLCVEVTK